MSERALTTLSDLGLTSSRFVLLHRLPEVTRAGRDLWPLEVASLAGSAW
jgi:hypothetical protein